MDTNIDDISKDDIDRAILKAIVGLQEVIGILSESVELIVERQDKLIDSIETMARGLGYEFLEEKENARA